MPNWISGTLKIRGSKENLLKFIFDGLESVNFLGEPIKEPLKVDEGSCVRLKGSTYIKGTRRGFIREEEIYLDEISDNETSVICLDSEFAWDIDADELLEIAKKYDIDIKIYAFEKGMEFNRDIEITQGKIVRNEEITFDDYAWDCILPNFGG